MSRSVCLALGLLAITCLGAACSREAPPPMPVANPSVSLARATAPVGSPLDITYKFVVAANAPPFQDDDLVFVHFLAGNRELLWTDDHQPPTPTRQWKPGQPIEYTRTVFIPKLSYVGNASIEIGLYSKATGTRLPLGGTDTGMFSYHVADLGIETQADNSFVVFKDGWHNPEAAEGGATEEWQWSKGEGTLAFRNPRRDATLFLQVDQPIASLGSPQQVELRIGSTAVGRFALSAGPREIHRIALSADQMGSGDVVDVVIAVDRTFIPAALPQLKSSDPRELGIRVFHAYVQPK